SRRWSNNTFCLARIWLTPSRCCNAQPPQVPKCSQRGGTRSGAGCSTSTVRASSAPRRRPVRVATTRSPGSAPATSRVLSSDRRTTPRPSTDRAWISTSNGVLSRRATSKGSSRGPRIVADGQCLLLLPAAAALVPPAAARAGRPLLGKHLADLAFPLRMAIGHGDLAVDRVAVAVVLSHRLLDAGAILQRQLGGIARDDGAVAGKAQCTGVEAGPQTVVEPGGHARLDGLDRRRLDADIR